MEKLVLESTDSKEKISAVVNIVKEIGAAAEGMMEASTIISNIASQTNLLSMNAAIEAAHAGETGKGFAVVADEIRKLSENSNDQTKAISLVLSNIKQAIDNAVTLSKEAEQGFDTMLSGIKTVSDQELEIKNAMKEQTIGSEQVLQAISEITDISNEINQESFEILSGNKTILEEMTRLTQITQEINQSMNEMSIGANEISEAVAHVTDISQVNKEAIISLDNEVNKFKIDDSKNSE